MKKKIFIIGLIIIIVVSISLFAFYFLRLNKMSDSNYVIPNVPYIGIYNHVGKFSYISRDTAAAVSSILEYWNPEKNDLKEINNKLIQAETGKTNSRNTVVDFINNNYADYSAEAKSLSFEELKKYINSNQRTPILIALSLNKNQPKEDTYYPYTVLIGIDSTQKKFIFHNYWFGNNYEIGFNNFDFIQKGGTIPCIVIQPKDPKVKIAEITARKMTEYPARTPMMNEAHNIFLNYTIGLQVSSVSDKMAANYFFMVVNDPKFQDWMPPYLKVSAFYMLADFYLKQNDFNNALLYVNKAIEENHDLDKSFKDWPGYEIRTGKTDIIDRSSEPYRVLGDIKKALKDSEAARDAYSKALEIKPNNIEAIDGLKALGS